MAGREVTIGALLILEYEQIKAEQSARVVFRDNLLYASLGSMAAVIAATLSVHDHANLLLLLPPVSVLLGWTYLVNDQKVSAMGKYIRTELTPRLIKLTGGYEQIFGWEIAHRTDSSRMTRKSLQLLVDLSAFCILPFAAVMVFLISGPRSSPFMAVAVVETLAMVVLGIQVCRYADISSNP